jgi:septal ring factor EnvC (AmiA/AmiB activator)
MTKSRKKPDDETKIQNLTKKVEELNQTIYDQSKVSEMYTVLNRHETRITVVEHDLNTLKEGVTGIKDSIKETNAVVKDISETQTKEHAKLNSFMKKYENDGPRVLKFIKIFLTIILFIISFGVGYIVWQDQDKESYQKELIEIYKERKEK